MVARRDLYNRWARHLLLAVVCFVYSSAAFGQVVEDVDGNFMRFAEANATVKNLTNATNATAAATPKNMTTNATNAPVVVVVWHGMVQLGRNLHSNRALYGHRDLDRAG